MNAHYIAGDLIQYAITAVVFLLNLFCCQAMSGGDRARSLSLSEHTGDSGFAQRTTDATFLFFLPLILFFLTGPADAHASAPFVLNVQSHVRGVGVLTAANTYI